MPAATMQAFLDAWLDELSATDALRLGAACRRAREALGAGGVAAAAFAVTRPWRAEREGSLRLWRRAWEACACASSALGLHGGAWLKTGTVIPEHGYGDSDAAVTLYSECAEEVAYDIIFLRRNRATETTHSLIAILLISGKHANIDDEPTFSDEYLQIEMDLHMLLLLSPLPLARPVFAAAGCLRPEMMRLADDPIDVCDTVIADGFEARLLVPQRWEPARHISRNANLRLHRLSSGMQRVARDGRAYDLFGFADWYRPTRIAFERWREAPPVAEVQDDREIALAGMLTRSAPPPAAASGAAGAATSRCLRRRRACPWRLSTGTTERDDSAAFPGA